jgi:hypothetical protein
MRRRWSAPKPCRPRCSSNRADPPCHDRGRVEATCANRAGGSSVTNTKQTLGPHLLFVLPAKAGTQGSEHRACGPGPPRSRGRRGKRRMGTIGLIRTTSFGGYE